MSEDQATWVYAITRDLGPAVRTDLRGVGGGLVRTVADESLTAVVGSVGAGAFSEQGFKRRLSDPGELEAIARAHHRVVEVAAAARPVLPLRLGTIYRDDDRVRALLVQRRAEFARTLSWLTGRSECGLKVWADPAVLGADNTGAEQPPAAGAGDSGAGGSGSPGRGHGTGTAYLSRRRAQLAARTDSRLRAAERAQAIHAALSRLAVAARQHPLQDARAAAGQGLMLLNGAYLVESARVPQFAGCADAVIGEHAGYRLEVTGPWPPYSFADGPEGLACLARKPLRSPPASISRR